MGISFRYKYSVGAVSFQSIVDYIRYFHILNTSITNKQKQKN